MQGPLVTVKRLAAVAAISGGALLAASPAFAWGEGRGYGPPPGYGPRPPVVFDYGPPPPPPYWMRWRHHYRGPWGGPPGFYGPRW